MPDTGQYPDSGVEINTEHFANFSAYFGGVRP